jgi:hypothetical protein
MTEIEEAIEQAAEETAADVAAPVAAIAAEHAATEAAEDAVEDVVEHVEHLVEVAEEAVEQLQEDAQWERVNATLMESERRITTSILSQLPTAIAAAMQLSGSPSPTTTPETQAIAETADELSEVADDLADEAEQAVEPETVAEFDPLAVESAPQESASRRRPRGLAKRR